jgi:hypothetical protein
MPGSIYGPNTNTFGTINGVTCQWNNANNNDVWIKYTATLPNTCLSLSGVSGVGVSLQTIVVTDNNLDNDNNPCTQVAKTPTNDPNWRIVSCPRNSIYTTTPGTQLNQQHCFVSEIGKTYYLVIDGDGGASSKFWVWGFSYSAVLDLEETRYIVINRDNSLSINIVNGVLITKNIKPHKQDIIIYDLSGRTLYRSEMFIRKDNRLDLNPYLKSGINLVRVVIDNNINTYIFKYIK